MHLNFILDKRFLVILLTLSNYDFYEQKGHELGFDWNNLTLHWLHIGFSQFLHSNGFLTIYPHIPHISSCKKAATSDLFAMFSISYK